MKFFLSVIFLISFYANVNSQVLISLLLGDELNTGKIEFGLVGGYNFSQIRGFEKPENFGTYNLGFYFDIRINKPWYFYTGVLVKSNLGTANLTANDLHKLGFETIEQSGSYLQRTNTFQVPFEIKYRFENNIFVMGGIQTGLLYDAWVEFNDETEEKETIEKFYNDDIFHRLDAGVIFGAGYKLPHEKDNGMSFFVQYYYGFVNPYKTLDGTDGYSALFIEATIPIGAD
jgi:hypothetical protein